MKNYFLLRVLDAFKPVFRMVHINYPVMRRILQVKLTLGNRRIPPMYKNNKDAKEASDHYLLKQSGLLILMSMFISLFMGMGSDVFLKMLITLGVSFFMLVMTMTSDFTAMLLDVRDKIILGVLPIDDRTLSTARFINAIYYVFILAVSINAIPLIVAVNSYGLIFGGVYLVAIFMMTWLAVFFSAFLYSLMMHYLDGEKLKDAINYAQVFIVSITTIGYQIVVRLFNFVSRDFVLDIRWWCYLIMPAWFAAPFKGIVEGIWNADIIALSLIAVLVTVLSILIYTFWIAPRFEQQMLRLLSSGEKESVLDYYKTHFKNTLIALVSKESDAKYIRFTWSLIARDRDFKLKLYPNLTMAALFPLLMLFNTYSRHQSFTEWLIYLKTSSVFLNIYFAVAFVSISATLVFVSEKHTSSWIYDILPNLDGKLMRISAAKVFIIRFILPVFMYLLTFALLMYGRRVLIDILIMFGVTITFSAHIIVKNKYVYPFSIDFKTHRDESIGLSLGYMFLTLLFAGIHLVLNLMPYGWFVKCIYLGILIFVLMRYLSTKERSKTKVLKLKEVKE